MHYALAAILGYLLGSIPVGSLVGRAHGIDIRQHGSGNIGATNVLRVLGKKPGILVFACDALKGFLAVVVAYCVTIYFIGPTYHTVATIELGKPGIIEHPELSDRSTHLQIGHLAGIIAAVACILGHNFPVWLRFKGGKGIATTCGVLLGLMPLAVAVAGAVWAAVFFTLRYVSVASLLAAATLPITVGVLWHVGRADGALFGFSLVAAALAIWRHRSNIQRLLAGTEPRFTKKSRAESQSRGEEAAE